MNCEEYQRGWHGGLPETPCGYGSKLDQTRIQRKWLPRMVAKYTINSIADIGAGDLNWIKKTNLGCAYKAYDLIPRSEEVTRLDLLTDDLPPADCLMVLWVLNHFSPEQQELAIKRLLASGSRYLIMTWDNLMEPCTDLPWAEMTVLRQANPARGETTGRDLEIRLINLCAKYSSLKSPKQRSRITFAPSAIRPILSCTKTAWSCAPTAAPK